MLDYTPNNDKVPTSRTINGYNLTANRSLTASDVGAVPTTRTVNSKALSSNITLSASDVGAAASSHDHDSRYKWVGLSTSAAKPANYSVIILFLQDKTINSNYFCRIYYQNSTTSNTCQDSIILLNNQTKLYCYNFAATFNSSGVSVSTGYYSQVGGDGTVRVGTAPTLAGILGLPRI